jgi:hypothetical protein
MTYAKRKAARPATAATTTEPWTLDADPVNWVGVEVAAGRLFTVSGDLGKGNQFTYVEFLAYVKPAVEETLAVTDGDSVGVTVYTLTITVGTQVVM